ncbi:MAG: nucleoside-diphosphate sugar epimerase [Betaproteobacteria bacterium HGW-Betaproteobacteria-7]|jgi:hypothetical protein|nr:MAG: nucleoside-diphosphate sugar epimerase [Betaproteobacteria bacterium HGW-Betaproteobacteria-7]
MSGNLRSYVVWSITDGRPGHLQQIRGLIKALGKQLPIREIELRAESAARALGYLATGRFPPGEHHPAPDLIIGAGHATHLNILAARRARGGKTVVLMKPSLPRRLFDLCLIPQHDGVAPARNVILTHGALNTMERSSAADPHVGLILLGGLSRHYQWRDAEILEAVGKLATDTPDVHWTLTTSPRTPASLLAALGALPMTNLQVVPFQQTTQGWLSSVLGRAGQVWVTPDSVSMVYEALTSGAGVGVFDLPRRHSSRVVRGLERLVQSGWVTRFRNWQPGQSLPQLASELDEAARCAKWIRQFWYPNS